jgi:uroporphyrin-3 C-methyltransferase
MEEVQYLLRLANHRLVIERSSQGALMLLEVADELIRAHENIDTDIVRQAIAADMMALQSVAKQDINGVYASLSALIKQSKTLAYWPDMVTDQSLTTNTSPVRTAEPITTIETDTALWIWQQIKDSSSDLWQELRQLIVIRQQTQPLQQLLSPQALLVVRMHIELALSQAQAALLRQQQDFYHISLDQVQELLHTYYHIDDPAVQAMSAKIHILKQHPVAVDLPDISASMSAFQQYMNLSSRQPLQPTKNQINTPMIDAATNNLSVQELQ